MLHTYIGGFTSFAGPVLGALLMTVTSAHLSTLTEAWPLYQGAFLLIIIVYSQHGLIGAMSGGRKSLASLAASRGMVHTVASCALAVLCGLAILAGFVAIVEMTQSWSANNGEPVTLLSGVLAFDVSPRQLQHWGIALVALVGGGIGLGLLRRAFRLQK
jgi:branched-chain amino acid transport system permease protein